MKTKFKITITLLLLSFAYSFSQTNKPEVGDFGVRTGFYIAPNFGMGVFFGKMLHKNLESGMGVSFTFNHYKHTTIDTITIFRTPGFSVNSENTSIYFDYTINLTPYLVYHFPIKNNFDVFSGGYIALSIRQTPKNQSTVYAYADNYEHKIEKKVYNPVSFGVGAGFIVGAQYFFSKNIAAGLSGTVGFSSTMQYGKQINKMHIIDSGSLNPTQQDIKTEQARTIKYIDNSVSLQGGVSINLAFYFAKHKKAATQTAN